MTPALIAASDYASFGALAVMSAMFGLLPNRFVMPCWMRKRREVALIFGVAAVRRLSGVLGWKAFEGEVYLFLAGVTCLSALVALRSLWQEARRGRSV